MRLTLPLFFRHVFNAQQHAFRVTRRRKTLCRMSRALLYAAMALPDAYRCIIYALYFLPDGAASHVCHTAFYAAMIARRARRYALPPDAHDC